MNGIIGEDILPTGLEEYFKRGIIVGYSNKGENEIDIRKTNLKSHAFGNDIKYYFELEEKKFLKD